MAEQPKSNKTSDEIDLGQLFQIIGRGFNKLGIGFLRLFLYLKKNAFILGGLIFFGVGIGYGLSQITEEKKKIEVIVKPNLDSENYLYDVVQEIENNLKAKDTSFFNSLKIHTEDLGQYEIDIEPIEVKKDKKEDLEYLELLEKFQDNPEFSNVVRTELLKNSVLSHRIVFVFRNPNEGKSFSRKVVDYINSNEYFQKLVKVSNENATNRIRQNESLIEQIDFLIKNYTESIEKEDVQLNDRIQLDNEKPMDITGLLKLKNELIQDTEQKRIELQVQEEPVNVLYFGKPQQVIKSFFGRRLVLLPSIFLALFFMLEFVLFLNRKSKTLGF